MGPPEFLGQNRIIDCPPIFRPAGFGTWQAAVGLFRNCGQGDGGGNAGHGLRRC